MATVGAPVYRRPPPLYRAARALRWVGVLVLVLLIIYAGTVAYSAYEAAHATVESRSLTGVSVEGGTINISGSFTLSNPGIYPISGLELVVRLANATGVHLGTVVVGPDTVDGGSTGFFPVALALPITGSSAAESLLFADQYVQVEAWANVTYAYLFPLSVALTETRSWGAPFEGFRATVGTPAYVNGTVVAPITLTWTNHASFAEPGAISFVIESAGGAACGSGSFPMDVNPGENFDETQDVTMNTGCSAAGGEVLTSVTIDGSTTSLPPEPIP